MWGVIGLEMLTFGLMFLTFAVSRAREPAAFANGQSTLDLGAGAIKTAVLLLGSWAVARGVQALRRGSTQGGVLGLSGGALCGLIFVASKAQEYAEKAAAGVDLSTDTFFTLYFLLTGFHIAHVLVATVLLAALAWMARDGRWSHGDTHAPETVAVFWHMVDLLWIVLFPLVYVLR